MVKKKAAAPADDEGGDAHRKRMAERSRKKSAASRDIGEIPPVKDAARRERCRSSFAAFCLTYFPFTFPLRFSPDHLAVIAKIELATTKGGLFALAMPRASGKTTLAEIAALWSILYGYQSFVLLIGSDADSANQMLLSIQTEIEINDLLAEDFPEAIYPIWCLDGEPRRCKGQTYKGERTRSTWSSNVIVMPTIPGSLASGAIVKVAGITGRIRGQKHKRADGKAARPTMFIADDVQTDESAMSESQCNTRERTLSGAVLGLAGPGKKIAGLLPCTIIRDGDVASRILDKEKHPEWNGSRFKLLYSFPADMQKWAAYRDVLNSYNPDLPGDRERAFAAATLYYLENHEAMDAGAIVAWPERYNPEEASAIQHAMNLWIQDERAFWAEYQNEPLPEVPGNLVELTADQIANRTNNAPRGEVPLSATRLTAFIDIQQTILFYAVAAWADDFTGHILDYGSYPKQPRSYFRLHDVQKTLAEATGVSGLEGQLYTGLKTLTEALLDRSWLRQDGSAMRIERCLIDANWGQSTDIVYQFCRASTHSGIVTPSHGKYVGASSNPITSRQKKQGERIGLNWVLPKSAKRAVRHALWDTNFWKSFLMARMGVSQGSPGSISLFGTTPDLHRMFADHLTAEYRVRVEAKGRTVDEWKDKPNSENHWLDCVVGAAVAASIQGASLRAVHPQGDKPKPTGKKGGRSWAEMQAEARAKRGA